MKILKREPYLLSQKKKEKIFMGDMRRSIKWHFENCIEFKNICENRNFNPYSNYKFNDIPYLTVSVFKNFELISVPKNQIIKTLYSSSTSGYPSKIMVDQTTINNQRTALNKILNNFLGLERRRFIIFDSEKTIKSTNEELSSRGTAIRGMLSMAKKMSFILNDNLDSDLDKLRVEIESIQTNEKICYFGFTWLIYNIYLKNKKNKELLNMFKKILNNDTLLLHIGGWKKLKDINISKKDFNSELSGFLNIKKNRVIDFYGMTEQLGTVYPDCEYGYKHIPLYSEIIIRDVNTLEPVKNGETGFIQLLSPLAHSYPGISILSDDMGRIIGVDDCRCGRFGKYFVFEKRSEKAELKGCGDTLKTNYGQNIAF